MMRIALANRKGGVGKTTIAVNLSAALARLGNPTLLVDLDPQAHASQSLGVFGVERSQSAGAMLLEGVSPSALAVHVSANLGVVPAHPDMTGIPDVLNRELDRHSFLARSLAQSTEYAYCIIDCPPSLDVLCVNGLVAADYALIPVMPEPLVWSGLRHLLDTIDEVRRYDLNPHLRIGGVVFNRPARTRVGQDVQDLIRESPLPVLQTVIPQSVRLQEAQAGGVTVFDIDPTCAAARAFEDLAREVMSWPIANAGLHGRADT